MKKLHVLFLVLGVASTALATTDWRGPAYTPPGTQDWFTASNWSNGVPNVALMGTQAGVRTYGSNLYDTSLTTCPIIAGGAATTMEVRVGGNAPVGQNGVGMAYLVMNSGTLATENFLMIGPDSPTGGGRSGTMYMHDGIATLGGAADGIRTSGHLYVGFGTGTSTLTGLLFMDGGLIDAGGDFAIGKNYTHGEAWLSGNAIIKANTLKMRPDNAAATALLDISGNAKVIINGNVTGTVDGYIDNGWIKTNGIAWQDYSHVYYDAGTNKTILMIPEPATICLLGLGALSLIRRKK